MKMRLKSINITADFVNKAKTVELSHKPTIETTKFYENNAL